MTDDEHAEAVINGLAGVRAFSTEIGSLWIWNGHKGRYYKAATRYFDEKCRDSGYDIEDVIKLTEWEEVPVPEWYRDRK